MGHARAVVFLSWRSREEPKIRVGILSRHEEDELNGGEWIEGSRRELADVDWLRDKIDMTLEVKLCSFVCRYWSLEQRGQYRQVDSIQLPPRNNP